MKTRTFTVAFLAIIAVAAIAAAFGHPVIPPEAFASLGMFPLVTGEVTISEFAEIVRKQGTDLEAWRKKLDAKLSALDSEITEMAKKSNRPGIGGDPAGSAQQTAFVNYIRTGDTSELKGKSMSAGAGPDGGYLVPEEIDYELTKYLRQISPMRQICRVVNVATGEFKQPHSVLGTEAVWVGEKTDRPVTATPGFKIITIPTSEVYAQPAITQTLLDDNAFNVGQWLIEELGDAFGDAESVAFINGNGTGKPRGLFTYDVVSTADAAREHDKFQYVATGGAGAFASSDPSDALISLIYAVKPQYRQNAVWLMSGEVMQEVRKFKGGDGEYLWQPGTQAGQPATLMGYPVFEDENLPAIAANSLSAAFGDFKRAYTITDRSTGVLRDPYSNKPYVNFYGIKRVGGGGGRDTRAVKFLKFATT